MKNILKNAEEVSPSGRVCAGTTLARQYAAPLPASVPHKWHDAFFSSLFCFCLFTTQIIHACLRLNTHSTAETVDPQPQRKRQSIISREGTRRRDIKAVRQGKEKREAAREHPREKPSSVLPVGI